LVVGSNPPYFGAARLSALAALRSGAGIVAIATRQQHVALMNLSCPELICHATENRAALTSLVTAYNAVVIGPGLGDDLWAQEMLAAVLECDLPVVIDADGLNELARDPVAKANWIITPHPGEAARLLNCSTASIQQDRFEAARQLQQKYQANIVLKGSGTLIKTQAQGLELCTRGNPGMASGGMGDVLAGLLGGLWVQGLDIDTVTRLGVQIHAHAADLAAQADGERGLLATDLLPYIRRLVNANS
ncbi:MAG: NAD(P)H-hydrate dehydratase, partial [Thiohalomonadales bacterium]